MTNFGNVHFRFVVVHSNVINYRPSDTDEDCCLLGCDTVWSGR